MRLKALRNQVEIEQNAPNVHTLKFTNVRSGWEQWLLLTGDRHHDNIHTDQALERRHLDLAMERDALVIDVGDLFCAMQGRGDPRGNYDDLRPEHKTAKYLDALVNTAADFYRPYADHFTVLGRGNHESKALKFTGTDLTDRLVGKLREEKLVDCYAGGYGGWVRLQFYVQKTMQMSLRLKYHHGSGKGAMMSFGSLDTRRMASWLPDADIVVNGHIHDSYILPLARERLSNGAVPFQDIVWFVRTMSYKDEWGAGESGFVVEKGSGPKPIGCVWGRLFFDNGGVRAEFTQDVRGQNACTLQASEEHK